MASLAVAPPSTALAKPHAKEFPLEQFAVPADITSGPDGALYAPDGSLGRVWRITTKGKVSYQEVGSGPAGVATGRDGGIYFAERNTNTLVRMSTAGVVTRRTPSGGDQELALVAHRRAGRQPLVRVGLVRRGRPDRPRLSTSGEDIGRVAGLASRPMTAVEAEGLVKHYPDKSGVIEAVRGVDLQVQAGEVFGFLGPNGAGKSTTVKMLTTLLSITAGRARVAGVDVAGDPDAVRHRIGVALQEAGLDPRQTGRELIVLQARLFGQSPADADRRTEELLALVELEDAADRSIKSYSGGMKRRLDLASALVHEPEVLFLDEPTTGLDPASRLTVWDEVRRINERGTTVFLTTQYLEEADRLCDRLAIIDGGLIVREGTPGAAQGRPAGAARSGRRSDPR